MLAQKSGHSHLCFGPEFLSTVKQNTIKINARLDSDVICRKIFNNFK